VFVPPFVTITTWLPIVMPYSALKELVITRYSRIPSIPSVLPSCEADVPWVRFAIGAPSNK